MVSERDAILVIGAGPAGTTAARLLAQWGHAVRLVTRPPREGRRAGGLAESLTPSCGKFFDLLGITAAVDAAGFVRATGNTVWWHPGEARVEMFADGARGWQVTSVSLERVMLDAAARAGAVVERRRLTPDEAAGCRRPSASTAAVAPALARRAGRVYEPGHRTVALSATWTRPGGWPVPEPTHTLLEARRRLGVVGAPGRRAPRRRRHGRSRDQRHRPRRGGSGRVCRGAWQDHAPRRLLAPARRLDDPVGWDASMADSTHYAGADWLVVGDAASFVDPLSSAGVKKALASGWLAAIVTHTVLTKPAMADIARRFFAEREAEMYRGYLALTRHYLREAAAGHARPFWAQRAEGGAGEGPGPASGLDVGAVRAAHERLRAAPAFRVRRSEAVRLEPRPAIAGREIVLEPRLVTAAVPLGCGSSTTSTWWPWSNWRRSTARCPICARLTSVGRGPSACRPS